MKTHWDRKLLVIEHAYAKIVVRESGAIDNTTRRLSILDLAKINELASPIIPADLVGEHNDIRLAYYRDGKKYQTSTGRNGPLEPLLAMFRA